MLAIVAACSSGSGSSTPTTPPPGSLDATSTSLTQPPTASMTFTGDAGLEGTASSTSVRCHSPDLAGLSIAVLAQPPDSGALARIRLWADRVEVIVGSGTGADYRERAFEGTGVTSFDPDRGAELDTTLTETESGTATTAGNVRVGALTAITGSVDCRDQTAGSSTLTITGETAEGALQGATLDPVRVECYASPDGDEVFASGLVMVGSTPALLSIGLTSDGGVTVDETLPSSGHRYKATGSTSVTTTGAHLSADVVDEGATPPRTLHLEGDLVCGRYADG
jgi:hypothetical protein